MKINESPLSFHIEALRGTLLKMLATLVVAFFLAYVFADTLFSWLVSPLSQLPFQLVVLSPLEGFFATLKLSLYSGLVFSSPLLLFFVLEFVYPALHDREKKIVGFLLGVSFVVACVALYLGICYVFPYCSETLLHIKVAPAENLWSLEAFVEYTLMILLATFVAMEGVTVFFFLVFTRLLPTDLLIKKRKHFYLLAFIVAAFVTPPDIFSQLIFGCFFILCYEVSVMFAFWRG